MKRDRRVLDTLDDDIRDHIERETRDNLDRARLLAHPVVARARAGGAEIIGDIELLARRLQAATDDRARGGAPTASCVSG